MDKKAEQRVIGELKEKVRELEKQLCQRTRNYLLQRGMKTPSSVKKEDREVQVEIEDKNYQERPQFNTISHSFESPIQIKIESSQIEGFTARLKRQEPSYFSSGLSEQFSSKKQKIGEILQHLLEQQRKREEQSCEVSSINDTFISQTSSFDGQSQHFDKEKRRMRREIKKLTAKLQFQKNISKYAKEGLLISEQENYQFRLKIKDLMRNDRNEEERGGEITALKEEIAILQAQLNHEKLMKEEYLENCLILRDQIERLQQENLRLIKIQNIRQTEQISELLEEKQQASQRKSQIAPQVFENIKEVAFSISNCIPVTKECVDVNFFKPENEVEILQALKRVQAYCKNIQKWELERIEHQNIEKNNFVKFIKTVSAVLDKDTKRQISKEAMKLTELIHFLHILQLQVEEPSHNDQSCILIQPSTSNQVEGV